MFTLTLDGARAVAQSLTLHAVAGPYSGPLDGTVIGLFVNQPLPSPDRVLGDLTEANFAGYARSGPVAWGTAYVNQAGLYVATGDVKQFIASGALPTNAIYGASLIKPGAGANDVQTVTETGAPTGGTFTLTFNGQVTAPIAYNAAAADVAAALAALPGVGAGNVAAAGGPLPGAAITVTFQGVLANAPQPVMMASAAGLTGGTGPAVAVAHTTTGVPAAALYGFDLFAAPAQVSRAGQAIEYIPGIQIPATDWGAGTLID